MAKEWLEDELKDPAFQRLVEQEDLVERVLDQIDALMQTQGITRDELARRMGCTKGSLTRLFRRTKKMTIASLVDVAFHIGYRVRFQLDPLVGNDTNPTQSELEKRQFEPRD